MATRRWCASLLAQGAAGHWDPTPNSGPQRSRGLVSRVDTVLGLQWLPRLLCTYQPYDPQLAAPTQVRELLAKGAKIEAVCKYDIKDVFGRTSIKDSWTALHLAAKKGHVAVVREPPGPGCEGPVESKSELGPSTVSSCIGVIM